jgi:hypothetical protein
MRYFAISTDTIALYPLSVEDGYYPVGINGNMATFENDNHTRNVELPVYDKARCTLTGMRLDVDGEYVAVPVVEISPTGEYLTDLSIEGGANTWWLVIRVTIPE